MAHFPPLRHAALVAALGALSPHAVAQVEAGSAAPNIEIADARDTGIKDFQALRGKVLMLDFFATW